jgi:hypothetical protein
VAKVLVNDKNVHEVHTAVLFAKEGSVVNPNYCVERGIEKERWIVFPYENKPSNA